MDQATANNTCRICLKPRKTLYSLYLKINGVTPYENLVRRTNLNIHLENSDSGPSSICDHCLRDLDVTISFLERCEQSNAALVQLLAQKNEESSRKEDVQVREEITKNEDTKPSEVSKDSVVLQSEGKCTKCEGRKRCKHSRNPLHTCQYCQKVFTDKSNFNRHIKRHQGKRDYPCPTCGKLQLTGWLAWHHCLPRPRRACTQPGCDKTFTSANSLTIHIRSHTGEKPFECNECGKKFVSKNVLGNHMRTHTGVKPYMCSVCGKQFTTNKLHGHVLAAHGLRRSAPLGRPRSLFLHDPQTSAEAETDNVAGSNV